MVPKSEPPQSLESLAVAARHGDPAAVEQLYSAAGSRLGRIALALGIPPDDAPDVVQEVLLSAWGHLEDFDPEKGSFVGWLIPGLKGRAFNRRRAGSRRQRFLDRLRIRTVRRGEHIRHDHETIEARLTLKKLLLALTGRQREVVALYEIEGLSAKETAGLLGMSEAGVRSIARDARQRLTAQARRLEGCAEEGGAPWPRIVKA